MLSPYRRDSDQKQGAVRVPDFRNLGVILRGLLLVEGMALGLAIIDSYTVAQTMTYFSDAGLLREPVLLVAIFLLALVAPQLNRLPYQLGIVAVLGLVFLAGGGTHLTYGLLIPLETMGTPLRTGLISMVAAGVVLLYFDWRQRTLSPAIAEARLSALQARIRPHFLFNSLNTVLGLIRSDPRRAESVLENLADLFRALMADSRNLVPLKREQELARAYVEIESLRLGDRLRVIWHDEGAPPTALVPQLILQPLLENAVLHGIEPSAKGGEVHVNLFVKGDHLMIVIRNPLLADTPNEPDSEKHPPASGELPRHPHGDHQVKREGNHMALANIRERLDLHFDAEARMTHFTTGGEFVVQIEIPLRHAAG